MIGIDFGDLGVDPSGGSVALRSRVRWVLWGAFARVRGLIDRATHDRARNRYSIHLPHWALRARVCVCVQGKCVFAEKDWALAWPTHEFYLRLPTAQNEKQKSFENK